MFLTNTAPAWHMIGMTFLQMGRRRDAIGHLLLTLEFELNDMAALTKLIKADRDEGAFEGGGGVRPNSCPELEPVERTFDRGPGPKITDFLDNRCHRELQHHDCGHHQASDRCPGHASVVSQPVRRLLLLDG